MLKADEIKRYARHTVLPEVGENGQVLLKKAKVLVIGAGGLGCPVLQYLNAAGVGTIGIIDDDRVEISNLQRQVLFNEEDGGKFKAACAAEKLSAQNSHTQFEVYCERLTSANALELFARYDLVIDGSDNFATRYLANDASVIAKKPLVFGSIFKFEGQVSVFNYNNGPTYRCLYPEPPEAGEVPNCSETGVLGVLPGICGTLMAAEAIKIICGLGEVLSGRMLCFDSLSMTFSSFSVFPVAANLSIDSLNDNYESFCGTAAEISAAELRSKIATRHSFQLIDVREESEYQIRNIGGLLIPLATLADNLHRLDRQKEVVVHCASGARSKKAVQLLREHGFTRVFNLRNGLLDF